METDSDDDDHSGVACVSPSRLRAVAGHVAVAYKKLMIVWGGFVTEQGHESMGAIPPRELLVYDTELDKWLCFLTTGRIPPETTGACGVIVKTTLYVFGGFTGFGNDYAHLYALDLDSLVWRKVKPASTVVPSGRHKLIGWHYENELYFFGGFGPPPYATFLRNLQFLMSRSSQFIHDTSLTAYQSAWNNQLTSFNLETFTWRLHDLRGTAPSARAAHSCALMPDKPLVFVFGGRLQDQRLNDMYTLHLPSMVWTKIDTEGGPCGRSWHSTVAIDPQLILLSGGFSQGCEALSDSWLFDVDQRKWTEVKRESITKPRLWHTAVSIDKVCYLFGGCKRNILDITTERQQFSNDLTAIPVTPGPLSQLCLQYIYQNQIAESAMSQLPKQLSEKFHFMACKQRQQSIKTPLDLLEI